MINETGHANAKKLINLGKKIFKLIALGKNENDDINLDNEINFIENTQNIEKVEFNSSKNEFDDNILN